jgi:hypothetical protein
MQLLVNLVMCSVDFKLELGSKNGQMELLSDLVMFVSVDYNLAKQKKAEDAK